MGKSSPRILQYDAAMQNIVNAAAIASAAIMAARDASDPRLAAEQRRIVAGQGTPEHAWQRSAALQRVPPLDLAALVPPGARAVIVAPHPDDEMLGCGGLLTLLHRLGREIVLIAVSDGERSHGNERDRTAAAGNPDRQMPYWSPHLLSQVRPTETAQALKILDLATVPVIRVRLPDGAIAQYRGRLDALLATELLPSDVLFANWRRDGHPDHEAVGEAAAHAARQLGCRLVEVPVWAWHWAQPDDPRIAWHRAHKLMLDSQARDLKMRALRCYRSQMESDPASGAAPIVPPTVLAYFQRPYEIFFV